MPTVLKIGPYRFFFYSNENNEPAHIHIQNNEKTAKFWLKPVSIASSYGFTSKELKCMNLLINENYNSIMEKWNEFFSR